MLWTALLTLTQLLCAGLTAQALGLCWALILLVCVLTFLLDLDLLAAAMLAVYSSVFLFITLLSIHLSGYWSRAVLQKDYFLKKRLGVFLLGLALMAELAPTANNRLAQPLCLDFLWQDYNLLILELSNLAVLILHWGFYRCFVVETVLLNLYLLLGLILGSTILLYLQTGNNLQSSDYLTLRGRLLNGLAFATTPHIRLITTLRRQTRRKNTSSLRV